MLRSITAGAVAAVMLAAALVPPPAVAQSSRPRPNDAYRPGPDQPGLGVLNGDGRAQPAQSYGAPADAPAYPAPAYAGGPQGYGAPSYGAPPAYGAPAYDAPPSPPPSYSQGQTYSQNYSTPPPYQAPYGNGPQSYGQQPYGQPSYGNDAYRGAPPPQGGYAANNGFGQPYAPPPNYDDTAASGRRPYMSGEGYRDAPPPGDYRQGNSYSADEIKNAGHGFFGSISQGLASVMEHAFRKKGRPNGYILGEEAGGAFVAGLRYGRGRLYTKDAGVHNIYWQGPSLGFDAGADGSKVMILVYNLRDLGEVYERFGGVDGSAYVVGGVGMTFLSREHVIMAPIRSGVGLRFGANVGYLKFTSQPTWNPF